MASYFLCCFLLQLLFGAVLAVADGSEAHTRTKMFAFSGMSFPLFSNLTLHKNITLFRNGKKNHAMIAKWEVKNATFTSIGKWKMEAKYVKPEYMGKIYLDRDLDKTYVIWICNVDQTHSAKYTVQYEFNTIGPEVELTILENKQHDVCLNSPPNSPEKSFGSCVNWIIGLVIAIFIIVALAIFIIVWKYKKLCSQPQQSSKSQEYAAVPSKGSGRGLQDMGPSYATTNETLPKGVELRPLKNPVINK